MTNEEIINQIDSYLGGLQRVKSAEAITEPDVSTTHPSKDVDDKAQKTTEGSRSAENTADVKKVVPASVDAAGNTPEGASKPPLPDAGFTGEGTNTGSMDDRPKDPGTTAPVDTSVGEKYSSEHLRSLVNRTNAFAAKIASLNIEPKEDKPATPGKSAKPRTTAKCAEDAGKEAAEAVINKMASDGMDITATIIKEAAADAQRYGEFLAGLTAPQLPAIPPLPPSFPKAAAASFQATRLFNSIKQALSKKSEDNPEAAAAMAGGGESTGEEAPPAPDAAAEGAPAEGASDGAEITPEEFEAIIQELEQGGINPDELSNVPPELLAQAIAQADQGGDGGNEGAPVPSETNPAMAG